MKANLKQKNRAFTLFVSLLVAALMLAIGFSIGNIIIKQLVLSSSGGGSQIGFYAADSGSECALYWDRKDGDGLSVAESPFSPIATSTDELLRIVCGAGADVDGGGLVYGLTKICDTDLCGPMSTHATTSFYIDLRDRLDPSYRACSHVIVSKSYDPLTGAEDTVIDSRGYNTDLIIDTGGGSYSYNFLNPGVRCNLSRPRVVERGLLLTY